MRNARVSHSDLAALLYIELDRHLDSPDDFKREACRLQKQAFLKKYLPKATPELEAKALNKFLKNALRVKKHVIEPKDLAAETLLNAYKKRCDWFFGSLDPEKLTPESLYSELGVGPGKSAGTRASNYLEKLFYGPVSVKDRYTLWHLLRAYKQHPTAFSALKQGIDMHGCVVRSSSAMLFVRKTVDEDRTIEKTCVANMCFQLAIHNVLCAHLGKMFGWNVSFQPAKNRELARRGSIRNDIATIDSSLASDSTSVQLVSYSLPPWLYEVLDGYRHDITELPDGRVMPLPMFSMMGNGFTFTLMTALMYCAVYAVIDVAGNPRDFKRSGVFGDDIVVPARLCSMTIRLLELMGYVVNREKTFDEGFFRESCGHDYFRGRFVRPFYLRELNKDGSIYVAANRLLEWGSFHSVDVSVPVDYLLRSLKTVLLVPLWSDYSSGLRVTSLFADRFRTEWGSWRYKALMPRAVQKSVYGDDTLSVEQCKRDSRKGRRGIPSSVNPDAVMLALVGGYLRNGKISERSEKSGAHYRLAKLITPNWDTRNELPCPEWNKGAEERLESFLIDLIVK